MPGALLHQGATVTCSHTGQAKPASTNPRVKVSGNPTAFMTVPYQVSGCTLPPPNAANGPCVSATWSTGTTKVTSNGQALAIMGGTAQCVPTSTPLMTVSAQTKVIAT
jgi:hypothetical protein